MGVGIQCEEGLRHLGGPVEFVVAMTAHLTFAIAAHAMRVDGQEFALVVTRGAAQLPQGDLQSLGVDHAMGAEQLMHGLVGGDKGQPVGQLKAFLRQCALVAQAGGAQCRLVDQLQSEARLDMSASLLAPATEQVPGAQTQMLWGQ